MASESVKGALARTVSYHVRCRGAAEAEAARADAATATLAEELAATQAELEVRRRRAPAQCLPPVDHA